MDRQSLLEQKRQRLKELKKRRNYSSETDDNLVDQIIGNIPAITSQTKQVSIGVQVNPSSSYYSISRQASANKEFVSFDKAIQATQPLIEERKFQEKKQQITSSPKQEEERISTNFDEEELNHIVKESLKLVNKLIIDDSIDTSHIINYGHAIEEDKEAVAHDSALPLQQTHRLLSIERRIVQDIDVSPHYNELMVVAYSEGTTGSESLPGLAVVYNIKNKTAFPEFYLNCTSRINKVKFDSVNRNQIFGGLANGKLVIWDLENSKSSSVAILPSISTPTLKFYHTSGITSIHQISIEHNNCIISTSLDGVVNVWSTNLLETPKLKSVRIPLPGSASQFKDSFTISQVFLVGNEQLFKSKDSNSPEYNFLNRLVVSNEYGTIVQLQNTKGYIRLIQNDSCKGFVSSSVTSLKQLNDKIFLSSSLDWHLKIWSFSSEAPLVKIPTKHLILDIAVHPNNSLQFAAVAVLTTSIIQIWDLNRKLMGPVMETSIGSEIPTIIKFDRTGENLIVGFKSGEIAVWSVDYISLNQRIQSSHITKVDESLHEYMHTNNIKI